MFSTSRKFIYIHVPKTGGNSIALALLPFSDDKIITDEHQDGVDRFKLSGDVTPYKHAMLKDYEDKGLDVGSHYVFISVRHPFYRALSFYFSPHKWARQSENGEWHIETPVWDEDEFIKFAHEIPPMKDFLIYTNGLYKPDDVIKMESIDADFRRIMGRLDIWENIKLVHNNKTAAPYEIYNAAKNNKSLQKLVEEHFAVDMEFFGY